MTQNRRYLKRRRGWRGRMHSDCSANGNILRVGRLLSVYTDRHQTCIICKTSWKNVSFNAFFFFLPFFFFLLYQKVIQLKTIDFFRSHIFFVRVIFCLIHPVPRLLQPNRDLLNKNIWRQNCLKPPLQGIVVHARFTPCRVEYDFSSLITN